MIRRHTRSTPTDTLCPSTTLFRSVRLEHDRVLIRRSRFLWNGTCYERLTVRNFDVDPCRLRLTISFAADFADLFEVRGSRRKRRGEHHPAELDTDGATLATTGLDDRRREPLLHLHTAPTDLATHRALFEARLEHYGPRTPTIQTPSH